MLEFYFNNKYVLSLDNASNLNVVEEKLNLKQDEYYLICNGKLIPAISGVINNDALIHIIPKLCGGKGGFGSMLRAIGAQIEKTTNREACRDLSGRRLRDINEEKRLKSWIEQQSNREQEVENKRLKKLEKLVQKPKHEFKDETYDKERSELPERLEEAIVQGLAAGSSQGTKRKQQDTDIKKKKKKLWIDDELDDLSSSDDVSDSDNEENSKDNEKEQASDKNEEEDKSQNSENAEEDTYEVVTKTEDNAETVNNKSINKKDVNDDNKEKSVKEESTKKEDKVIKKSVANN